MAHSCYLLDTHTLIWFQENNSKIPDQIMNIITEPENTIFFSQVTLFEITIKQKIGKLPNFYALVQEVYEQALSDGFTFLDIKNQHIYQYNSVPLVEDHRDPFDRLLIATAISENADIITADEKFKRYNSLLNIIW